MRDLVVSFLTLSFVLVLGCSSKEGAFFESTSGSSNDLILISSGDSNTRSVLLYNQDGSFNRILYDYRTDLGLPRGIAPFDSESVVVSLDNTDRVSRVYWKGENAGSEELFANSGLGGAIYQLTTSEAGDVFVVESNYIERYDSTGARVGTPYIGTTEGSCVLSSPRGIFLTSDDRLIVTNHGGSDQLLIYDVSDPFSVTCLSANNIGNNPYGVIEHSDGNLYVVTQGDDQVYRTDSDGSNATSIWSTDTSIINNPTGIIELANGNLAIASSANDQVWEMDTSGTLANTSPLILDPLVLNITDIKTYPANFGGDE